MILVEPHARLRLLLYPQDFYYQNLTVLTVFNHTVCSFAGTEPLLLMSIIANIGFCLSGPIGSAFTLPNVCLLSSFTWNH